jgi:hypothetical protein
VFGLRSIAALYMAVFLQVNMEAQAILLCPMRVGQPCVSRAADVQQFSASCYVGSSIYMTHACYARLAAIALPPHA